MKGFVGFKRVHTSQDLQTLLDHKDFAMIPSYYFLCWSHKVSGIRMKRPDDFLSPEGQIFNSQFEIRWKQRGKGYEVLLLSIVPPNPELGFTDIPGDWKACDRQASFYKVDETRFPKGFTFKDANDADINNPNKEIPVGQRYFQDSKTATVHFVALTVESQP